MLKSLEICNIISENSFIVTLLVLGLFYFFNRRYGISFMKTEQLNTNYHELNSEYCTDPNCVRCNKYHETVSKALKRISLIQDREISFKIQKGLDFVNIPKSESCRQKPNVFYFYNLESMNIWDKQTKMRLKDCLEIEKSAGTIKSEINFLLENPDVGIWQRNRTPNGSWDVLHFINQGSAITENQSICPKTMSIINNLTSVMKENVFGNVLISVLKPGTLITPHYGPTNIRLRCHLGLRVSPEYLLTVDGKTTTWEDGKCLVFDDSFLHSVKHDCCMSDSNKISDQDRVVLIIDLWHPDLSDKERDAINLCFHP